MAFILRRHLLNDTIDMIEATGRTATIAAGSMVAWDDTNHGVITAVAGTARPCGIAHASIAVGAKGLISPLLSGEVIETYYTAGTPYESDEVELAAGATGVIKNAGTNFKLGRVIKVIDATAKTVEVLVY